MKNIATFMLVSALMLGFFTSCDSGVQHRTFRGIYADDPAGMEGLYNPERGFRLEVALDVTEKNYVWAPEEYPDITSYLEEQSELYASDSVSLVQTYFYLTGAVGKELTGEDITGEYIGAAKMKADFIPQFVRQLETMIGKQQHSVWWENVLYAMTGERDIYVQNVENKFWAEVDYIEDYERILNYRKNRDKE